MTLNELITKGFLNKDIINPVTNEEMQGCVLYRWKAASMQYDFEYTDPCEIKESNPDVIISYNKDLINSDGWGNVNMPVTITGNEELRYCLSNIECEPNEIIEIGNNTKFITNEGVNYIYAIASNSIGTSEKNA